MLSSAHLLNSFALEHCGCALHNVSEEIRLYKQKFWRKINQIFTFIVTKEHALRVSHSLKTFCLEIMPLISKYDDVLGSIVTFMCNNQ